MLHLTPGTVVKIVPPSVNRKLPFLAEIDDVHRRYGLVNHGKRRQNPVLVLRNLETGEIVHYDAAFVTEIISRNPRPFTGPENFYRAELQKYGHLHFTDRRNQWIGSVVTLVEYVIAGLPIAYPFPVNSEKTRRLFYRDRPGCICATERPRGFVQVRRKPFEKWVRANAYHFMQTRKEFDSHQTMIHHENELTMEDDMEQFDRDHWEEDDRNVPPSDIIL